MTVSWPGPMEHVSGCGVFFGINDDRNCSFTLPGREQTNNRAELLAVVAAMEVHDGNLEIRSDSDYAVRIATSRRSATRATQGMRRSYTSTSESPPL